MTRSAIGASAVPAVFMVLVAACNGSQERTVSGPYPRGMIILGIDGMDPVLLRRCMREGRAPNLSRMAKNGTFVALGTSTPPQSPVAWSDFITGSRSHLHGIYDFVHRDLATMSPYLSTSRTEPPEYVLDLGRWTIPLSSGKVKLMRKGRPFWEFLAERNIPATVVKIPSHFPPGRSVGCRVLSGMGTPDLLGTYGTFQFFTDDRNLAGLKPAGGRVHRLKFGRGQHARSALVGPPNPLYADGRPMKIPLEIVVDRKRPVALVRLQDTEHIITPGEWTDWIPVHFDPGLFMSRIPGMVRLYLKSLRPHVALYTSPVNIDPLRPAMPVSWPRGYAGRLARRVGRFYTQGMGEETKALEAGLLTEAEFLAQAMHIFHKRLRLLRFELNRFRGGLLFFYFSSVDQVSHMFWRALSPRAPEPVRRHANVLVDLYARMDRVVGEVILRADSSTVVMVMSDHGFAPCGRNFYLNTWLAENGYLAVLPRGKGRSGPLGHIDWARTQAYGLGLNQLFVNLEGREPQGTVSVRERDALLRRIARELEGFTDPDMGRRVVNRAVILPLGPNRDRAPDLIVGYNRGYRCGKDSALGQVTDEVVKPNPDKWSGDHCMDAALVPGVLLVSRPLGRTRAALTDLAPTVLEYFGIKPPVKMDGRSLKIQVGKR